MFTPPKNPELEKLNPLSHASCVAWEAATLAAIKAKAEADKAPTPAALAAEAAAWKLVDAAWQVWIGNVGSEDMAGNARKINASKVSQLSY